MRNSLYLTALGVMVFTSPAMADGIRTNLDAQSVTSAQTQNESKGLFSGIGDRLHGFFAHDTSSQMAQLNTATDANGGVVVQNDGSAGVTTGTTTGTSVNSAPSTYDDTVDNENGSSATTSTGTNAQVGVGGVDANVGANIGSSVGSGATVNTDGGLNAQTHGIGSAVGGSLSSQTGGSVTSSGNH